MSDETNAHYRMLCDEVLELRNAVADLRAEIAALRAERDSLARFKKWVHDYLDSKGVPHHPPGTHGAEGCRIGDRMDYVWAEIATLRADRDAALEREMRAVRERDKADLMLRELGQEHHEALRQIAGINADRDAAVAKAVGVERERAAKLADDCAVFWRSRRSLADAIRRGE